MAAPPYWQGLETKVNIRNVDVFARTSSLKQSVNQWQCSKPRVLSGPNVICQNSVTLENFRNAQNERGNILPWVTQPCSFWKTFHDYQLKPGKLDFIDCFMHPKVFKAQGNNICRLSGISFLSYCSVVNSRDKQVNKPTLKNFPSAM